MRTSEHSFHIPVMGLGYTIDTPIKVGRFGITSVVSIIEDNLVEQLRKFYSEQENEPYEVIHKKDHDARARRITGYLNVINRILARQVAALKIESFEPGNEIMKYFEMLHDNAPSKILFNAMLAEKDETRKSEMQEELRTKIIPGAIDVNIMTKCDRINFDENDEAMPVEFADAMAALRGFANSEVSASVEFSAGMNPRLYSYCESFPDFFADENGHFNKMIILKVSDYRSALIQGKFLAKKGLWVTEFRVESGLNCGGHAFPTEGYLMGPILEEFKEKREELKATLHEIYKAALESANRIVPNVVPEMRVTVQGGIGTYNENKFLLEYYNLNATGWGSPFLMVPEATNVDDYTLHELCNAVPEDFYLSHASPLGIPFNNFRRSSGEAQRIQRIEKNRPGSPCYKHFLAFSTEFQTKKPICTSSREYQHLKLKELKEKGLSDDQVQVEMGAITVKDCLCEGLGAAVLLKNKLPVPHNITAVSICPGPNLAYFSKVATLREMIDHIYGRANILNHQKRSSMFVNELRLYVDYLKKEIEKSLHEANKKQIRYFEDFKSNLLSGIAYYETLVPKLKLETEHYLNEMYNELCSIKEDLVNTPISERLIAVPA